MDWSLWPRASETSSERNPKKSNDNVQAQALLDGTILWFEFMKYKTNMPKTSNYGTNMLEPLTGVRWPQHITRVENYVRNFFKGSSWGSSGFSSRKYFRNSTWDFSRIFPGIPPGILPCIPPWISSRILQEFLLGILQEVLLVFIQLFLLRFLQEFSNKFYLALLAEFLLRFLQEFLQCFSRNSSRDS